MARTSIYLNFMGQTELAFNFYKSVFKTEFLSPMQRMCDIPKQPGSPELPENEKNMVMHVELPILGGAVIMGTDFLESMGHNLQPGNNITINLEPDTRLETDDLFNQLSAGGTDIMPLTEMFWGGYYGTCVDKYGIRWMFNCNEQAGVANA